MASQNFYSILQKNKPLETYLQIGILQVSQVDKWRDKMIGWQKVGRRKGGHVGRNILIFIDWDIQTDRNIER
jgi:hypothetical protein